MLRGLREGAFPGLSTFMRRPQQKHADLLVTQQRRSSETPVVAGRDPASIPKGRCAPRWTARLALLLIVLPFTTVSGPVRANDGALEYRLKAVFLYNLARFVEWPGGSQDQNGEAIVIGILGDDPFGPILESTIRGKNVDGRQLRVKRMEHVAETGSCHLLFISRSQTQHLAEILRRVPDRAILTVGDSEG